MTRIADSKMCQAGRYLGTYSAIVPVLLACVFLFPHHGNAQQAQRLRSSQPEKLKALPVEKVRVETIRITGNSVISDEELVPLVRPFTGKELDLSELQEIADVITDVYRERGYTTARAYLPPQEITDGVLEIAVLEGRVGQIIIEGNTHYSTDFIRRGFTRVMKDKVIKHSSLEKSLVLLNENLELKVTAILQAGKTPGTTDILVKVEDKFPLELGLDGNNFGTEFTSRNRFGARLEFGNLILEGSVLSLRGVVGFNPDDFFVARGSYTLPINSFGTKLGFSYIAGDFEVGQEFEELGIKGETRIYGSSLTHPLLKTRFQSLEGEFGFDAKDSKQFLLDSTESEDNIRLVKAGVNYDGTDSTGRTLISARVFQGLGEALGGMDNNDPISSRQGADNRFTKVSLDVARVQRISKVFSLIVRASGQASTESLVAGEQFYIGGADSVRGYPVGEFVGDDGYNVSAEVRVLPFPKEGIVQLAFFIDHGGISNKNPGAGLESFRDLTGAGFGLRLSLPYNVNVRVDVGFPVEPSEASNGEKPTVYVQGAVSF